jgi:GT2 family glycosyltransferase
MQLVCATRASQDMFPTQTALGKSATRLLQAGFPFEIRVFTNNTAGLPAVYNMAIDESDPRTEIFVFVHDDIWIVDLFWYEKIFDALAQFDIVGIVGSRRRVPGQRSWAIVGTDRKIDSPDHLSGRIAHGTGFPPEDVSGYGVSPAPCVLLDGLFLAVRRSTLLASGLRFDERFPFDFYDMDFCRQAEARGLRMGTWPISLIHESRGNIQSPRWQATYPLYLAKYGELPTL